MNNSLVWRIFLRNKFIEVMTAVLYAAGAISAAALLFMGLDVMCRLRWFDDFSFVCVCIFAGGFILLCLWGVGVQIWDWLRDNWYKAKMEAALRERQDAQVDTHKDYSNIREKTRYE